MRQILRKICLHAQVVKSFHLGSAMFVYNAVVKTIFETYINKYPEVTEDRN